MRKRFSSGRIVDIGRTASGGPDSDVKKRAAGTAQALAA